MVALSKAAATAALQLPPASPAVVMNDYF